MATGQEKLKKFIGQKIEEARKAVGLSQNELSKLTRLDQSSISQYEAGNTEPTFSSLMRIACILQIDLDYFRLTDDFIEDMIEEEERVMRQKVLDKISGGKKQARRKKGA